ncbi:UNVERIFIED_CONTAM: Transposon Ty3-G Gag-Pol polyprotein [Sesamum latifolium]|uniref:Transposon Ty3-G Gag-Pol polyprotein n=1 Tax=Sesamum latifolium TaxID=2727402 RepID=A0AAW2UG95_9LAMI
MAVNNQQFETRNDNPPRKVNEVSASIDERLDELTSLVKKFVVGGPQQVKACGICTSPGYFTDACPTLHEEPTEHADTIGGFFEQQQRYDPFSNTYNPGWKDHPNLRYGNQSQNFQKPPPPQTNPNSGMSLEDMMKTLITNTQQFQQDTRTSIQNLESQTRASIQNLESQVSQLASSVSRLESQAKTEVSTKRGHARQNRIEDLVERGHTQQGRPEIELEIPFEQAKKPDQASTDVPKVLVTKPPFPERFSKAKKEEEEKEIFKTFRKVEIWDNSPNSTSILLGRPFLKTARTKIDVHNGTLTMEFDGEEFSTYDDEGQIKMVLERNLTSTQMKALEEFMTLDPNIGESILASTLELKELPKHLKYAFLGENDTLPVIISNKLSTLEEEKLIRVLREFREAIGWTIADIKGLSPSTCMHRILLEEGAKPSREAQCRLNPPMMEVVKKEILILLNAGMIFPISDSPWFRLVFKMVGVFPSNTGSTRRSRKDNIHMSLWHFCLPTDALRFVQCTRHIPKVYGEHLSDYVEQFIEVFMDDFTVYGNSFNDCLNKLAKVLERCIEKNLLLNYEKCHFMVDKGLILGHIVSSRGIEVDQAKINVIKSLSYPASVREIRSFLGHAGFYRRFIKDFFKIAQPLCKLLQKDEAFEFDEACKLAFNKLESLTSAPIIQPPNWELPFEIMCDASNHAVDAVLGQ